MAAAWESAPLVDDPSGKAAWESAPVVDEAPVKRKRLTGSSAIPGMPDVMEAEQTGVGVPSDKPGWEGPRDDSSWPMRVAEILQQITGQAKQVYGAGETAVTLGTGATGGMVGGALGMLNNAGAHGLRMALGQDTKSLPTAEESFSAGAAPFTYQPRTEAGQQQAAAAGELIATHGPALIPIAPEMAMLGKTVKSAAKFTAAKAGEAVTPKITPEMADLVRKADSFGISVRPDQVTKNALAKKAGEFAQHIPLSGAKTAANQEAFNVALLKQLDPESTATKVTPAEFARAQNKSGQAIGSIAEKAKVPLDETLTTQLMDHLNEVKTETPEVRAVNVQWVKKISEAAGAEKVIPGAALRKLDSQLGRQLKSTPDGDLRRTLIDLHETLMDGLERNLPDADIAAFRAARRQYAIGKAIEPVVAKSIDGDFPAPQLMGRMTATAAGKRFMAMDKGGVVGDLAKVGQLLKEPATSGTAERQFLIGATGLGGAGYLEPHAAAGVYGAANLYNRAGPALTRRMAGPAPLPPEPVPPPGPPAPPGLSLGFDPQPRPGAPTSPLGDLIPDWQTLPGAAPPRLDIAIPAAGLYEPRIASGTRPTRAKPQQPVVPGRPDLPDAMIAGEPAEVGANAKAGAAMRTMEAALARAQQAGDRDVANIDWDALRAQAKFKDATKSDTLANNASGQTEISAEAAARAAAELKKKQWRVLVDETGNRRYLNNPADVDFKPGKNQVVMQRGIGKNADEWIPISQGPGVSKSRIDALREALKKWKPPAKE